MCTENTNYILNYTSLYLYYRSLTFLQAWAIKSMCDSLILVLHLYLKVQRYKIYCTIGRDLSFIIIHLSFHMIDVLHTGMSPVLTADQQYISTECLLDWSKLAK